MTQTTMSNTTDIRALFAVVAVAALVFAAVATPAAAAVSDVSPQVNGTNSTNTTAENATVTNATGVGENTTSTNSTTTNDTATTNDTTDTDTAANGSNATDSDDSEPADETTSEQPSDGGDEPPEDTEPAATQPEPEPTPSDTSPEAEPSQPTETAQNGDEPTAAAADLTLSELRRPGVQIENAPPSVRGLGPTGAIAIQYQPIQPLSPDRKYLEPGTQLNANTLELYSTRFGPTVQPLDVIVHVAFYQTETRQTTSVDGQTTSEETVAVNVTKQETAITIGEKYDRSEVSLTPHFDDEYQMAIWITDENGAPIGDARWSKGLTHRSSQAAQSAGIDSESDLWTFIFKNIVVVGVGGLLAGFAGGRHVLNKIGRGTGLGLGAYAMLFGIVAFVVVLTAYIQAAAVISSVPIVWGLLISVVGFVGYVETAGPDDRRVLFERDELTEAKSASGDEVVDAVYEDIEEKLAVFREDGSVGLPADGIRPAIARYFAEPAMLDDIDLSTSIDIRGDFDEKYVADPDSGEVLVHTPAHLEWDPQLFDPVPDGEPDPGLVERLNWPLVFGSALSVGGGYYVGDVLTGFGAVGAAVGLLGVAALGFKARDGVAEFEPAPIHMRPAKATIKNTAIEYDDAKTIEEADRQLYKATATSASELRRRQADQSRVTSRKLMEQSTGVSFDPDEDAPGTTPVEHPEGRRERRRPRNANDAPPADEDDDEDDDSNGGGWRDV